MNQPPPTQVVQRSAVAKPISLLRRITIRVSLVTLFLMGLSYAWVYYQIYLSTDHVTEGDLLSQAKEIVAGISVVDGKVSFHPPNDPVISGEMEKGDFRYAIALDHGDALFVSRWPPALLSKVTTVSRASPLYEAHHEHPISDTFIGTRSKPKIGGQRFVVQVERNSRHLETLIDTVLEEFFYHGAWLGIPFLILLLFVISWTTRGALAPLHALSRQAAAIGPLATDVRLEEATVPREILPLVQAVNRALDRIEIGFRTQQEFTADAAHELRTPLAVLCAHIDTLDDRDLSRSLRKHVNLLTRIVTQLLGDARLDALAFSSPETTDLCEVVDSIDRLTASLAAKQRKSIVVDRPTTPVVVRGNSESIFHAVRNLVDNAIHHAYPETTIDLCLAANGVLAVRDHGPGIPDSMKPLVFSRFWRANRGSGGAGLGLSIVKKTMEIHGGTISVEDTPGGGATISLVFRLAEAGAAVQAVPEMPSRPGTS